MLTWNSRRPHRIEWAPPVIAAGVDCLASLSAATTSASLHCGDRVDSLLIFIVPRSVESLTFNEMTIRYHLIGAYEQNSARVAVVRFVFIPMPLSQKSKPRR